MAVTTTQSVASSAGVSQRVLGVDFSDPKFAMSQGSTVDNIVITFNGGTYTAGSAIYTIIKVNGVVGPVTVAYNASKAQTIADLVASLAAQTTYFSSVTSVAVGTSTVVTLVPTTAYRNQISLYLPAFVTGTMTYTVTAASTADALIQEVVTTTAGISVPQSNRTKEGLGTGGYDRNFAVYNG
jgi:hypothetical protein